MAGCEYSSKRNGRDENAATKRKDEKHVLLLTLGGITITMIIR